MSLNTNGVKVTSCSNTIIIGHDRKIYGLEFSQLYNTRELSFERELTDPIESVDSLQLEHEGILCIATRHQINILKRNINKEWIDHDVMIFEKGDKVKHIKILGPDVYLVITLKEMIMYNQKNVILKMNVKEDVTECKISPDYKLLATINAKQRVQVWCVTMDGELKWKEIRHCYPVNQIQWLANNILMTACKDEVYRFWQLETNLRHHLQLCIDAVDCNFHLLSDKRIISGNDLYEIKYLECNKNHFLLEQPRVESRKLTDLVKGNESICVKDNMLISADELLNVYVYLIYSLADETINVSLLTILHPKLSVIDVDRFTCFSALLPSVAIDTTIETGPKTNGAKDPLVANNFSHSIDKVFERGEYTFVTATPSNGASFSVYCYQMLHSELLGNRQMLVCMQQLPLNTHVVDIHYQHDHLFLATADMQLVVFIRVFSSTLCKHTFEYSTSIPNVQRFLRLVQPPTFMLTQLINECFTIQPLPSSITTQLSSHPTDTVLEELQLLTSTQSLHPLQQQLLTNIDCTYTKYYLLRIKHYASTQPTAFDWWCALKSKHQQLLIQQLPQQQQLNWDSMKQLGLVYWMQDPKQLQQYGEQLARVQMQQQPQAIDPNNCALLYMAMNKRRVWELLWKRAYGHPEQQSLMKFLSNDFTLDKWKQAAAKNAFVLLGRQRFELAAAFFLLSGHLVDCLRVIQNQLKDSQLVLLILRLYQHSYSCDCRDLIQEEYRRQLSLDSSFKNRLLFSELLQNKDLLFNDDVIRVNEPLTVHEMALLKCTPSLEVAKTETNFMDECLRFAIDLLIYNIFDYSQFHFLLSDTCTCTLDKSVQISRISLLLFSGIIYAVQSDNLQLLQQLLSTCSTLRVFIVDKSFVNCSQLLNQLLKYTSTPTSPQHGSIDVDISLIQQSMINILSHYSNDVLIKLLNKLNCLDTSQSLRHVNNDYVQRVPETGILII